MNVLCLWIVGFSVSRVAILWNDHPVHASAYRNLNGEDSVCLRVCTLVLFCLSKKSYKVVGNPTFQMSFNS